MRGAGPHLNAKILAGFDAALRSYPGLSAGSSMMLSEAGLDPEAALKADQLPLNRIADLFEIAARHTRDECFGLHLARHLPPGATGSLGFVLSNAPDLRSFAISLARFIKLRIDALDIAFTEVDGMARLAWTFGPELVVPHKQLTELLLAMFMDRARFFLDETWQPAKAEFTYREPNSAGEYETKFGKNLVFNAPVTRVMAPSASFRRPSQQANPLLFKKLHGIAEKELEALAASNDIVDRLGKLILDKLSLDGVDLGSAAHAANMTPRQLQTELQRRGTSFENEMTLVRQRLAIRYLRDTELPMTEIALLLGYSELSAFTRAAKSWFGKAPGEMRAAMRCGSASSRPE